MPWYELLLLGLGLAVLGPRFLRLFVRPRCPVCRSARLYRGCVAEAFDNHWHCADCAASLAEASSGKLVRSREAAQTSAAANRHP